MFSKDNIQEIGATLGKNKLRTLLTGFAVAWGVLLLVLLLSAGSGFQNGIKQNVSRSGQDVQSASLDIWRTTLPYKGFGKGRYIYLRPSDCQALLENNPHEIKAIAPFYDGWAEQIKYAESSSSASIVATVPYYAKLRKQQLRQGRFLSESDIAEQKKVIVLSHVTADLLFGKDKPCVGEMVNFNGLNFQVIGVVTGTNGQWSNNFVPMNTFSNVLNSGRRMFLSLLMDCPHIRNQESVDALRAKITRQLALRLNFSPEDKDAVWVNSPLNDMQTMDKIFNGMDMLLWLIGMSTLLIGIVGVANIMQVAVSERQREIGIRKALGAKPKDIIAMILQEAIFVTLIAGLIGLVLGVGTMELVSYLIERFSIGKQTVSGFEMTFFVNPTITLGTAVSAILMMAISGAVAGYFPARKAVRIPAVEAMRG